MRGFFADNAKTLVIVSFIPRGNATTLEEIKLLDANDVNTAVP